MSSPSKNYQQQKTIKQKYIRDQVSFMVKLKQHINRMQIALKDTNQVAVSIDRSNQAIQQTQQNQLKDKHKSYTLKQRSKIIAMALNIKNYSSQIKSMLNIQIRCILSNERTITPDYLNLKQSKNIPIQTNMYYSTMDNQAVQQMMVYDNYENHVENLKQKLYQCQKVVGKLSDNVRKVGKPMQYGLGLKRLLRKDRKFTEKYLKLRSKVMNALTKNAQLVVQARKITTKIEQRQRQRLEQQKKAYQTIKSQTQQVSQFINSNIGYKNYSMYKRNAKRSKSQSFKKNPIYQSGFQTQINQQKEQDKQANQNKAHINPLRTALFNQIICNLKYRLKIHNQKIQVANVKLKNAIEQKNKIEVLKILRDSHQKALVESEIHEQNIFNGCQDFYYQFKKLGVNDYRLLLEIQAQMLRKNYAQMRIEARFKAFTLSAIKGDYCKDFPVQKSIFRKLKDSKFPRKRTQSVGYKKSKPSQIRISKQSLLFSEIEIQRINLCLKKCKKVKQKKLDIISKSISTQNYKTQSKKGSLLKAQTYSNNNSSFKFRSEETNQMSIGNNYKGIKYQY